MTLATNGDFDQGLELSEKLLTAAASATLGVGSPVAPLPPGLDVTGSVSAKAGIAQIWFRTRPQPWASRSGFGNLARTTSSVVTLALEVPVHIDLQTVTMVISGKPTTTDLSDARYDKIRTIDFTAFAEVTDHVEVQTLNVTKDREAPGVTVAAPVVVIDFNPELGIPTPRVEVRLNRADVQKNAPVQLMMVAAELRDGHGGGDAALTALMQTLSTTLVAKITEIVQTMKTWQLETDTGKALLYDTSHDPQPVLNLDVKTLDESLFIGIDYLTKRGVAAYVTRSTRRVQGARLDDFAVTVSNRMLLRGILRPALSSIFPKLGPPGSPSTPLARGDFMPGEYCVLRGPVANVDVGGGTSGTLESLAAFVNRSSQVQILLEMSADPFPGVTMHASLDLRLAFEVTRAVPGSSQALRLTAKLANPGTAVVAKRVDMAWWWYVLGLVLGPVGVAAVGIIDGIVVELKAAGELAATMKGLSLPATDSAVPLPVTLTSPGVELNQPSAPGMPTPLGPMFAAVFGGFAHDLYIGSRFSKLPDPLPVEFVIPDSAADPGGRLDGVGGMLPDGSEWALPIDDAIALVDAGHKLTVTVPPAKTVLVVTAFAKGIPYLRTEKDDFGVNNLGNLPKRPTP